MKNGRWLKTPSDDFLLDIYFVRKSKTCWDLFSWELARTWKTTLFKSIKKSSSKFSDQFLLILYPKTDEKRCWKMMKKQWRLRWRKRDGVNHSSRLVPPALWAKGGLEPSCQSSSYQLYLPTSYIIHTNFLQLPWRSGLPLLLPPPRAPKWCRKQS